MLLKMIFQSNIKNNVRAINNRYSIVTLFLIYHNANAINYQKTTKDNFCLFCFVIVLKQPANHRALIRNQQQKPVNAVPLCRPSPTGSSNMTSNVIQQAVALASNL